MVPILDSSSEHRAKNVMNQVFVKGIRVHRQSRYFISRKTPLLLHTCATRSELPSYMSTMIYMDYQ